MGEGGLERADSGSNGRGRAPEGGLGLEWEREGSRGRARARMGEGGLESKSEGSRGRTPAREGEGRLERARRGLGRRVEEMWWLEFGTVLPPFLAVATYIW
jgi:hypothetical protein